MGVTEDLADDLARDVIEASELMDDETLMTAMAKVLGASSTTAEEAFLTAVRVRTAEKRGRKFLDDKIRKFEETLKNGG
ncbi:MULTISPECIES: hypothetical protein [unclassified Marinovum]